MRIPALSASLLTASLVSLVGGQTVSSSPLTQKTVQQTFTLGEVSVVTELTTESDEEVAVATPEAIEPEAVPVQPATPAPVIVVVAKGDSLSKIAQAHSTTVQRLFDANGFIANPSIINPGDQVRIPVAEEVLAVRSMPIAPKPVAKATTKSATTSGKKIVTDAPAVIDGSVWDALARCESGGNWAINTGNGYYGGLQFTASTWRAVGGQGLPHENSREEQILRGQILQARSGWGQWPACTKKLGLR